MMLVGLVGRHKGDCACNEHFAPGMQIKYPWYNLFCTADYTPEAVGVTAHACHRILKC